MDAWVVHSFRKEQNVREIHAETCRVCVCLVADAWVGQTLVWIDVRVHFAFMAWETCGAFTYQQLIEES